MRILLTGFAPFAGERINPAYEAVRRLPDRIAGAELRKLEVPTDFARCGPAVEEVIRAWTPDIVLCAGQAGGRACVTVERVAVNLMDASIPDNAGAQPVDKPVAPEGPAAYFATVPVKAMVRRVREGGIPCQLSYSAGTYVCNCLMYRVLHMAALRYPGLRAGFVHVPYLEEQAADKPAGTPSAALETITRALALAAEAAAENREDAGDGMGTIC